ncbi:hypothetical protein [Bifidobacterium saguini]|nr:hypothetical protein [Bifidobacterium saguini]
MRKRGNGNGLRERMRSWWGSRTPRQQAGLLVCLAVVSVLLMMVFNPFHPFVSDAAGQSEEKATRSVSGDRGSDSSGGKTTTGSAAGSDSMFSGDTEAIAGQVRSILNSPDDGSIDPFGQLLIRYGDADLGNASSVFEAVGRQEKPSTVRPLAESWYGSALGKATEYRRSDLESGLPGARTALSRLGSPVPSGCSDLESAVDAASKTAADTTSDYESLTKAQQDLTKAVSSCASKLDPDRLADVFPQDGPSATVPDSGQEGDE